MKKITLLVLTVLLVFYFVGSGVVQAQEEEIPVDPLIQRILENPLQDISEEELLDYAEQLESPMAEVVMLLARSEEIPDEPVPEEVKKRGISLIKSSPEEGVDFWADYMLKAPSPTTLWYLSLALEGTEVRVNEAILMQWGAMYFKQDFVFPRYMIGLRALELERMDGARIVLADAQRAIEEREETEDWPTAQSRAVAHYMTLGLSSWAWLDTNLEEATGYARTAIEFEDAWDQHFAAPHYVLGLWEESQGNLQLVYDHWNQAYWEWKDWEPLKWLEEMEDFLESYEEGESS